MRRLLQRLDNGLYYGKKGTWTKDPNAAFNFDDSVGAVHCCMSDRLPPVYYVLKFENPEYDIRLGCCTQTGDQVRTLLTQRAGKNSHPPCARDGSLVRLQNPAQPKE